MDPKENQHFQHEQSQQRQDEIEKARQRIEGGEKPWEEEPGVMSVVDAVRDLHFPKKIDEIREKVGDREVYTSGDIKMPLDKVLGKLKEDQFTSLQDFQTAVQKHWQGIEYEELPEDQRAQPGSGTGVNPKRVDRQ